MNPSRHRFPGLALVSLAFGALLSACVGEPPDDHDGAVSVDGGSAAPDTPPVIDRDSAPVDTTRGDAAPAPDASPAGCDELPALSAPRNANAAGTTYLLADLRAARNARRTACVEDGQDGADLAVVFTSPVAATWRFSVEGGRDWERWNLTVLDGCAARSTLARCVPYARSVVAALAAGQSITLVADGLAADGRFGVRAERVTTRSTAPEVRSAQVIRWLRGGFAAVDAGDVNTDLAIVVVELRDALGALVPVGGLPRREVSWNPPYGGAYRVELRELPERAVRARVWAEDMTGLASDVREVPIEPRPVVAVGERCDTLPPNGSCAVGALCVYERATGRHCRPRLVAHYDPSPGALRIDLNAAELGMAAAEVTFLDSASSELGRTERFAWTGTSSVYSIDRSELLARQGWTAPAGFARVRVAVIDREGRLVTTLEAPVASPVVANAWSRCDLATTARIRCRDGLVCVATPGNSDHRTCQVRDPGCPAAWRGRRWEPVADAGTAALEATAETEYWTFPACMVESYYTGDRAREDVVEFVAPVAGTYRFRLTARAPREARAADFGLAANRYECRADRAAPEIACSRAGWSTGTGGLATIDVAAAAGEHIPLRVSSRGAILDYRLEVALPAR